MKFSLAYKLSWKDIISVVVMSLVLGLLFLFRGVDYHPGVSDECKSCIKDIGTMPRGGHYEEMLWNGVRHVHHSSNPNLSQFTKSNGLLAVNNHQTTKNCIDCHNDSVTAQAPSLGDLWVKFPRLDKETGRIIDFEKAVQYEFVKRYGGTKPFYNDVRITEIMVYAYEKAREKKLVFDVEPDDGKPISDDQLAALGTTFTCLGVFKKYGNPKGDIAPYIVKGCNIFTDTVHNRPAGYGFWKVTNNCTSCHLYGGSKEYAANVGDGMVNYPGVYSHNNMVYTNRMRIARCYAHSINELLYGSNSEYYKLLTLYMTWIAEKNHLVIGENRESRGVQNVRGTAARHASNMAGQKAYKKYCEKCHGTAGYGTDRYDDNPNFNPPPLTGSEAYIRTATMSYSSRMASFILNNMPPGATHDEPVLTPQEALDIAEFISVQTRPSSPGTSNLTVFYNYLVNRVMESWFEEKTNS
jgi:cytochrome c